MHARQENENIIEYRTLPKKFNKILGFANASEEVHKSNGFLKVNVPEFNPETERLIPLALTDLDEEIGVWNQRKETIPQEELDAVEIDNIKQSLKHILGETLNFARAILMGKTINDDLDYFEAVYKTKYEACKGNTFDTMLAMELTTETDLTFPDGTPVDSLELYKAYVIAMYEAGQNAFEQVKAMVEVFRKVILKDVVDENYDLAKLRIQELDNISADINPTEFGVEFSRIINLTN